MLGTVFPVNLEGDGKFSCIINLQGKQASKFEEALKSLSIGDEVAVKKGRRLLSIAAKNCDPIKKITIIATSLGVSPALQMVQYLSAEQASVVEEVDFLWVNKNRDEFICDDLVEGLSRSFPRLEVTRFINNFMDSEAFETKDFAGALPAYDYGSIVVVCGPKSFAELLRPVVTSRGYAPENVLQLETK